MAKLAASANPRRELATKFRVASQALVVVYGISVIAGAIPANLLNPSWYLGLNFLLVTNGPILVVALLLGFLGVYWDPKSNASRKLSSPLSKVSRFASRMFIVVVLAQLVAGYVYFKGLNDQQQKQRQDLAQRQRPLIQQISSASDPSQLARLLQSLPASDRPSSSKPSLTEQKQALITALKSRVFLAERSLAQQRRQRLLAMATESLRIIVSAIALFAACHAIAQRNTVPRQ